MSLVVYEYEKCSTCRNAIKWLDSHKVSYKKVPIVDEPPTFEQLKDFVARSGLPITKFFNTSGVVYREMKLGDKLPVMSDNEKLKLLASEGKLIKRPLAVSSAGVLLGFREEDYKKAFAK